jgi:hypothetical protein
MGGREERETRKIKVKHTSTKASKRRVGFLNSPAGAVGRKRRDKVPEERIPLAHTILLRNLK